MRHILIYLFIALGIFGLLGWYFARQDTLQPDIQKVTAEANAIKQTQRQVELLFDGMGEERKNNFRTALQDWRVWPRWTRTTAWAVPRCS